MTKNRCFILLLTEWFVKCDVEVKSQQQQQMKEMMEEKKPTVVTTLRDFSNT